jgi:hypothetical protein
VPIFLSIPLIPLNPPLPSVKIVIGIAPGIAADPLT